MNVAVIGNTLVVDNSTGFDIDAMAQLTEKEFIDAHKDTDGIKYGKTDKELDTWLKGAYKAIKAATALAAPLKEEKENPDTGKTGSGK